MFIYLSRILLHFIRFFLSHVYTKKEKDRKRKEMQIRFFY